MTETAERQRDRIVALLTGRRLREQRMFGSLAVMVDERLVVAVQKDGALLLRVDADEEPALVSLPGAAHAEMSGRRMGAGWLRVEADAVEDDPALGIWLERALGYLDATGAASSATR